MHPVIVMLSLVKASTLRVRPDTSSWRHPTEVHPSGKVRVVFKGALALALGVEAEEELEVVTDAVRD